MTEIEFMMKVSMLFEQLEDDDLKGFTLNGDVREIRDYCDEYLKEKKKWNGESNGSGKEDS